MQTYFDALDNLLESKRSFIPNRENSLSGVSDKMKGLQKILSTINEEIKALGNEYLPDNLSTEEKEEIHSISVRKLQQFINSFKIPLINAQISQN